MGGVEPFGDRPVNLTQIATAEQEIRGKLNHHVAARSVSIKETAKHDEIIAGLRENLVELRQRANDALDACERIASDPSPADAAPEPSGAIYEHITASNAA